MACFAAKSSQVTAFLFSLLSTLKSHLSVLLLTDLPLFFGHVSLILLILFFSTANRTAQYLTLLFAKKLNLQFFLSRV
jgi:hypothetical protein